MRQNQEEASSLTQETSYSPASPTCSCRVWCRCDCTLLLFMMATRDTHTRDAGLVVVDVGVNGMHDLI